MAIVSKSTIIGWLKCPDLLVKVTNWVDSFYHKDEKIPEAALTDQLIAKVNSYQPLILEASSTVNSTTSTSDVVVVGMSTAVLVAGTYSIIFNGQVVVPEANYTTVFNTAVAVADLDLIFQDIVALPVTNTHALNFGNGESLSPGVYDINGASLLSGTLTLDGGGDTNALFVMKITGAFNTAVNADVYLSNGATAKNVFWYVTGAVVLGEFTNISGTFLSIGSITTNKSTVNGQLFSKIGAVSFETGDLAFPSGNSLIDFRSLSNFVIFTSSGIVTNLGRSKYNGNIGSHTGLVSDFYRAKLIGTIFESGTTPVVTPVNHVVTFSIYKNNLLIPYSSRSRTHLNNLSNDIALHAVAVLNVNDIIDVRWKVDAQISDGIEISIYDRILELIK
jgi:hypothetical protein